MKEWTNALLSELTVKVGSGATPSGGEASYKAAGTPLIRSMNVVFFGFKRAGLAYLDGVQATALSGAAVQAGDVLLNITGASIGRVTRAPKDMDGARVNQHVCIIRPAEVLDSRYLNAYFSSPEIQKNIWADNTGTTRQALTKQQILGFSIPLAPLNEQRRIADKLDTVLTRVDALNDSLARITPLLKRFRQSVLAAATSGRLTEDWQSIATPYKTASLSELAEARLGKMLDKEKNTGEWVQYLRNVNVRWFAFDLDDLLEMKIEQSELANLSIKNGDVLICEGGEPGRCAVWKGGETHLVFQKALHRVRVDRSKLLPDWLAINLKHQADSSELDKLFTGSTIKHLTGSSLAKLEIPIPSVEEQTEIVRRVEILFAYADRLEARLQTARTAADRLTPALLAKAFRGELVPQDPSDEPATELLRRLREARAAEAPAKKPRGRKAAVVQGAESEAAKRSALGAG